MRIAVVAVAVLVTVLLVLPRAVPDAAGQWGSLVETFRPWLVLAVPVLLVAARWRRSALAAVAALVPVVAWFGVFGGHLLPRTEGAYDLTAVQHNVSDTNADPAGTVRDLLRVTPDLVALEEVTPAALPAYAAAFPPEYAHHTVQGTVGLWSRFPLTDARLVDIRPSGVGDEWNRGLRATAATPRGPVAVYVAHLPSVRLGPTGLGSGRRDESATRLGAVLAAEPLGRLILLGDLNTTVDDRGLRALGPGLATAGSTFAFSWPAAAPLARIDQIMGRGVTVTRLWALPATGSDHLPVAAHLRL